MDLLISDRLDAQLVKAVTSSLTTGHSEVHSRSAHVILNPGIDFPSAIYTEFCQQDSLQSEQLKFPIDFCQESFIHFRQQRCCLKLFSLTLVHRHLVTSVP